MKEPIYRVVLRIIEVHEDDFTKFINRVSTDRKVREFAIEQFIRISDIHPQVRRIYLTAKTFNLYKDAQRCLEASLREFDFKKSFWQYFKDIRIEKHFSNGNMKTVVSINELTGKGEEA